VLADDADVDPAVGLRPGRTKLIHGLFDVDRVSETDGAFRFQAMPRKAAAPGRIANGR